MISAAKTLKRAFVTSFNAQGIIFLGVYQGMRMNSNHFKFISKSQNSLSLKNESVIKMLSVYFLYVLGNIIILIVVTCINFLSKDKKNPLMLCRP